MAAGCSDGCVLQARRIARVRPFNTGEWLGRWHHAVRLGGAVRQLEASQALRLVLRKQQAGLDELARECTEAAEARDAAESALVDAQAQRREADEASERTALEMARERSLTEKLLDEAESEAAAARETFTRSESQWQQRWDGRQAE